ncbi:MAG: hypothetical protein KF868_08955 [Acidobacteria bacterium]|nr:hypothetical protein [Acidobacteriota bacterium]MCW5971160.1 hypothetical protein [Blastocatellales bacterium]
MGCRLAGKRCIPTVDTPQTGQFSDGLQALLLNCGGSSEIVVETNSPQPEPREPATSIFGGANKRRCGIDAQA